MEPPPFSQGGQRLALCRPCACPREATDGVHDGCPCGPLPLCTALLTICMQKVQAVASRLSGQSAWFTRCTRTMQAVSAENAPAGAAPLPQLPPRAWTKPPLTSWLSKEGAWSSRLCRDTARTPREERRARLSRPTAGAGVSSLLLLRRTCRAQMGQPASDQCKPCHDILITSGPAQLLAAFNHSAHRRCRVLATSRCRLQPW